MVQLPRASAMGPWEKGRSWFNNGKCPLPFLESYPHSHHLPSKTSWGAEMLAWSHSKITTRNLRWCNIRCEFLTEFQNCPIKINYWKLLFHYFNWKMNLLGKMLIFSCTYLDGFFWSSAAKWETEVSVEY